MSRRQSLLALVAFSAGATVGPRPANAEAFPPKGPVNLLVGFAAGGAADTAARLIAKKLGDNLGHSVVVQNLSLIHI